MLTICRDDYILLIMVTKLLVTYIFSNFDSEFLSFYPFRLPKVKVLATEPLEHTIYDSAHRLGVLLENCDAMFTCPISLVDWAKGYYNAPSPNVDTIKSPWALFSNSFS